LRKDKAEVFDQEIANHLISSIIDILSKKLPQDVNFNNAKLESVVSKIRLVPVPKAIVERSVLESVLDGNGVEKQGERVV
jgi:hypothetical protein